MKLLNFAIVVIFAADAFVTSTGMASGAIPANALYLGRIFADVVIASVNIVLTSTHN